MSTTDCPFEADLVDTIHAARWPAGADPSLVAHVETCEICHDVAAVLPAVLELVDQQETAAPPLPEAGAVWLRAQLRARAEAERTATHPITAAQAVAIGCGAAGVGTLFGATSPWIQANLGTLAAGFGRWWADVTMPDVVVSTLASHLTMAIGAGLACLLVPVAAYLVTRE